MLDPYAKLFLWWSVFSSGLLGILAYRRGYLTFLSWELFPARARSSSGFRDYRLGWRRHSARTVKGDLRRMPWRQGNSPPGNELCLSRDLLHRLWNRFFARAYPPRPFGVLKNFVRVYCVTFPIIVGAISVARERNLGLLEWQLSFPIVAAKQWPLNWPYASPLVSEPDSYCLGHY